MAEETNGGNALRVPVESVDFTLTIHHNVVSGAFEVEGWERNILVTIGMLNYALDMVKQARARAEIQREMQRRPVVLPPGLRGV